MKLYIYLKMVNKKFDKYIKDKNKIKYKKLEVNVLKIITLNNISKKP